MKIFIDLLPPESSSGMKLRINWTISNASVWILIRPERNSVVDLLKKEDEQEKVDNIDFTEWFYPVRSVELTNIDDVDWVNLMNDKVNSKQYHREVHLQRHES